jgi:hypothetical protein
MLFLHYQNLTTYFHGVWIQSKCYIIDIYLNVDYNIAIYFNVGTLVINAINVKIQLSPWLSSSF